MSTPKAKVILLGNSRTTPGRVMSFHYNDGIDQFFGRSFRTGPTSAQTKTACGTWFRQEVVEKTAEMVLRICHVAAWEKGA
jgi:hypothetical protein